MAEVADAGVGAVKAGDGADTLYDNTVGPFAVLGVGTPVQDAVSVSILPIRSDVTLPTFTYGSGEENSLYSRQIEDMSSCSCSDCAGVQNIFFTIEDECTREMAARLIGVLMKKQVFSDLALCIYRRLKDSN